MLKTALQTVIISCNILLLNVLFASHVFAQVDNSIINLSESSERSGAPVMATANDLTFIAWNEGGEAYLQRMRNAEKVGIPINISKSQYKMVRDVKIASSGNHVYILWTDGLTAQFGSCCVSRVGYFSYSKDGGNTFSDPAMINRGSEIELLGTYTWEPHIVANGARAHFIWTEPTGPAMGIHVSTISLLDGGVLLRTEKRLNALAQNDGFMQPHLMDIAVSGTNVYAVWEERDKKLTFTRSTNNGSTFESPQQLDTYQAADLPNIDIEAINDRVYILWGENQHVYLHSSNDRGATFTKQTLSSAALGCIFSCLKLAANTSPQALERNEVWAFWDENNGLSYKKVTTDGDSDGFIGSTILRKSYPAVSFFDKHAVITRAQYVPGTNGKLEIFVLESFNGGENWQQYNFSNTLDHSFAPSLVTHNTFFEATWPELINDSLMDIYYKKSGDVDEDLKVVALTAVQAPDNPHKLVKGKPTVIRAVINNGFLNTRTAKIQVKTHDGITEQNKSYDVSLNPGENVVWLPNKKSILNTGTQKDDFIRPEGPTFRIEVVVDSDQKIAEVNETNNKKDNNTNAYEVVDTKGFNVLVVPIEVKNDTATSSAICDAAIINAYGKPYVDAIFPIDERETKWTDQCSTPLVIDATPIQNPTQLFNKLYLRLQEQAWTGNFNKVIGAVREGWFKDYYKPTAEESEVVGLSPRRANINNSLGAVLAEASPEEGGITAAHELIHNLGFDVNGSGHQENIPVTGFWVQPQKGMQRGVDIMHTSVAPSHWIANNTFDYLLDKLTKQGEDPAVIGITGVIGKDDTVDIPSWYIFDSILDVQMDQSGEFTLEYQNANEDIIGKTGFDASYETANSASDAANISSQGLFAFRAPVLPEMKKLQIKRGDEILFTRTKSDHAPLISIQNPHSGDIYNVGDTVTVNWQATDGDNDTLNYIVNISTDGGTSWIPLGAHLADNQLTFKATKDLVTTQGKIRVFATDGLNTTIAQSAGTFAITQGVGNGKIAFTRNGQIWTTNPDGTDLKKHLNYDSYGIQVDSGETTPVWSPDGTKLVTYASYVFSETGERRNGIWISNEDGTGLRHLVEEFSSNQNSQLTTISCPSWSADGEEIRFIAQNMTEFTDDIWSIKTDGTNLRKLYDWPDDFYRFSLANCPSWSPDDAKILISTSTFDGNNELYLSNPDLSNRVRLTNYSKYDWAAKWSPNGSQIAFLRESVAQSTFPVYETWIMNADGTNQMQVSNYPVQQIFHNASDYSLAWAPDGASFAFSHKGAGQARLELWKMDVLGSNQVQITDDPNYTVSTDGNPGDNISWQKSESSTSEPDSTPIHADAGNNYTASEGAKVMLDASNSTASAQIHSYKWDLDGDGEFDDATGANTHTTFNENGEFNVAVKVTDSNGLTDISQATIVVTNNAPEITNTFGQMRDKTAEIRVDFIDQGNQDTHTAIIEWGDGQSSEGNLSFASASAMIIGSHTYDATGIYTPTITLRDDDNDIIRQAITLTQVGPNHVPLAGNITTSTNENTPLDIALSIADLDEDFLSLKIVEQPTHGIVIFSPKETTQNSREVTYIPNKGFSGADNFSYKINDGKADSNTAKVTITVVAKTQPLVCTNATANPQTLWPPSHEFISIDIMGIGSSSAVITKKITSIKQDEALNDDGDSNTTPDGKGIGTSKAEVRAERSGNKNGRVYTIGFSAQDDKGATCSGVVKVGVPPNKKDYAIDDGANYNSIGQ